MRYSSFAVAAMVAMASSAMAAGGFVGGGVGNSASGDFAVVVGGYNNDAHGVGSAIGGGGYNVATGDLSTIAGGGVNQAVGPFSAIGGGIYNATSAYSGVVAGGVNIASGTAAFIGGGTYNTAAGSFAMILGGSLNTASGSASSIIGGARSEATGAYSLAGGRRAKAQAGGAWVLKDGQDRDVISTAAQSLTLSFDGGLFADVTYIPNGPQGAPTLLVSSGTLTLPRGNVFFLKSSDPNTTVTVDAVEPLYPRGTQLRFIKEGPGVILVNDSITSNSAGTISTLAGIDTPPGNETLFQDGDNFSIVATAAGYVVTE